MSRNTPHFQGMQVGALESRMAKEMESLIRRYHGTPCVAPSMQETPLEAHPEVENFGRQLLANQVQALLLLTGVGTRTLFQILERLTRGEEIMKALQRISLFVRGPKPAAALRERGLTPHLIVPEPNTWKEILQAIDEQHRIAGLVIAVQEYGVRNFDLLEGLRERGATVMSVPIYRWSLPDDTGPLRTLITNIVSHQISVLLITNAVQIDHVFQIVEDMGKRDQFLQACQSMVIASIGPTASERIRHYGLPVDFEPTHAKMGIFVKEFSECASQLLQTKQTN